MMSRSAIKFAMLSQARLLLGLILSLFASRSYLLLENLALRQQVTALRRHTKRPRITQLDRLFWVTLRSIWSQWRDSLIIVTPDTVVGWHRAGFLGNGSPNPARGWGASRSPSSCARSSCRWPPRILPGVLLGFTANSSN